MTINIKLTDKERLNIHEAHQAKMNEHDTMVFSGGGNLEGFERLVHESMMKNELNDGKGAYKLSNAGGKSGYSFGGNQMDLTTKGKGYDKILEDIMKNAKHETGEPMFTEEEIDNISELFKHKASEGKLEPYRKRIDDALSSEYGIEKLNTAYKAELKEKIAHIEETIIKKLPTEALRNAANTDEIKLILVDYHNQYDLEDGGKMHDFLSGKTVTTTINNIYKDPNLTYTQSAENSDKAILSMKHDGTLDAEDVKDFIRHTKYGHEQAYKHRMSHNSSKTNDVERRFENMDTILNDPELSTNRTLTPPKEPDEIGAKNTPVSEEILQMRRQYLEAQRLSEQEDALQMRREMENSLKIKNDMGMEM